MSMVTVKTADLIGPALDWAVDWAVSGKPLDVLQKKDGSGEWAYFHEGNWFAAGPRKYSTDWSQGGPLIDKYQMTVICMQSLYEKSEQAKRPGTGIWSSKQRDADTDYGWLSPTPLIAVCRAIVRHAFGDEVQVPADLEQP